MRHAHYIHIRNSGGPSVALQAKVLTPLDIVKFGTGYAQWIQERSGKNQPTAVIGRDARLSGQMVRDCLVGTLNAMGVHVIDLGLSTTPTRRIGRSSRTS